MIRTESQKNKTIIHLNKLFIIIKITLNSLNNTNLKLDNNKVYKNAVA